MEQSTFVWSSYAKGDIIYAKDIAVRLVRMCSPLQVRKLSINLAPPKCLSLVHTPGVENQRKILLMLRRGLCSCMRCKKAHAQPKLEGLNWKLLQDVWQMHKISVLPLSINVWGSSLFILRAVIRGYIIHCVLCCLMCDC